MKTSLCRSNQCQRVIFSSWHKTSGPGKLVLYRSTCNISAAVSYSSQWFCPSDWPILTDFVGGELQRHIFFFGKSYRKHEDCSGSENTPKNLEERYIYLNISKNWFKKNILKKSKNIPELQKHYNI